MRFMAVLSFPRLMGWRDPDILGRIFTQVGWLVGGVPVVDGESALGTAVPEGPDTEIDRCDPMSPGVEYAAACSLNSSA